MHQHANWISIMFTQKLNTVKCYLIHCLLAESLLCLRSAQVVCQEQEAWIIHSFKASSGSTYPLQWFHWCICHVLLWQMQHKMLSAAISGLLISPRGGIRLVGRKAIALLPVPLPLLKTISCKENISIWTGRMILPFQCNPIGNVIHALHAFPHHLGSFPVLPGVNIDPLSWNLTRSM